MAELGKPIRRDVSEEELTVAFSGPAPGANRFFITIGNPGVRIAFVEQQPGGRIHFRSATTLHPIDAIALHKVLKEMLSDIEVQITTAEAAASGTGTDGVT